MVVPDLKTLGLNEWQGCDPCIITQKPESSVLRVSSGSRSAVLKLYLGAKSAGEVAYYHLLQKYNVPTLTIYASGPDWVLMEDILTSSSLSLATIEDMDLESTGTAVAAWYRTLHEAGNRFLKTSVPEFLTRWSDSLTPESVKATAERLGMADISVWNLAIEHVEHLKIAFQSYPETLNYNDFHWSNLALSRGNPKEAIVFDYHLLSIGPVWSDIRNVCGSLGPMAQEAFLAACGELDESISVFDRPLSLIYSLGVASQLERLPKWASMCLEQVASGELDDMIRAALDACY